MQRPPLFETRWEFIEPQATGKTVLDIGPAELIATVNSDKAKRAIHNLMRDVATSVTGLELSKEQTDVLVANGYDIVQGNAEDFDLGQKFQVVVAGEVIEHLSNPGNFLECVKRHLEPGGRLVMTTPNRFSARDFLSAFRRNTIPGYAKSIAKHVMYFDENCLKDLLERHGYGRFEVAYYEWVGEPYRTLRSRAIDGLVRRRRPQFAAGLMIAAEPV
jgi:2-polyprenyl-3-methyl-5-hydroxy-6-metoxy-1,4-benzoquinol methylase